MTDLERRYARLVRLFYPAHYRRERGAELVGTYMDLAAGDRRWPAPVEVADLALGGMRERWRGAADLEPGFRLAGTLALLTASAFAAGWSFLETSPPPAAWGVPVFGPFVSLGIVAWASWLLAVMVHVVAPGRARLAAGIAVAVTIAVVPVSILTGLPRPPLFVLLPQIALGLVAIGGTGPRPLWVRLLPLAAATVAVPAVLNMLPRSNFYMSYYTWTATQALPAAGTGLLVLVILLGIGLAVRGDHRGGWASLVLLGPIGMLSLHPLAGAADGALTGAASPGWTAMLGAAVVVAVVSPALLAVVIAARRRPGPADEAGDRCAACGAPVTTAAR